MSGEKKDNLKVDPPLFVDCKKSTMEQKWTVVSFISPEDQIKQRFLFEATRFLYHDINKQLMDTTTNIARDINSEFEKMLDKKIETYKSSADPSFHVIADLIDKCRKEMTLNEDTLVNKTLRKYKQDHQDLVDRFEVYKVQNSKELEVEFEKSLKSSCATSVRGFKVRGAFEELSDAQAHAKMCRSEFEPAIHCFVAPVGYWCPWDPNADAVQDQDHLIPELNNLMGEYNKNVEQRNEFFEKRKHLMIEDANENKNKTLRNKLLQRIEEKRSQRMPKPTTNADKSK
jgi:thiol-disulfide isomerase/thioredoxin